MSIDGDRFYSILTRAQQLGRPELLRLTCGRAYDIAGVEGRAGTEVGEVCTGPDGRYTIPSLTTGTFSVLFDSFGGSSCRGIGRRRDGFEAYYNDKGSLSDADSVAVTVGQTTAGIDLAARPATALIAGAVRTAGRTAIVPLQCVGTPGGLCRATVLVSATASKSTVRTRPAVVGRATALVRVGVVRVLRVSLNAEGARLLARLHRLSTRVTLTAGNLQVTRMALFHERGP